FGCAANNVGGHVSFNLTAAGDGNTALAVDRRGIVGKTVTSIDIVQDETGTAILMNLKFTGTAAVTATPTPTAAPTATPTATPTTPTLATTDGDVPGVLWVQPAQLRRRDSKSVDLIHDLRADARRR